MNLALRPRRVIDTTDRRVLGAFQFVDALLGTPLVLPATIEPRGMTVSGAPGEVPLSADMLRIRSNRHGVHVVFAAPFFGAYTTAFASPTAPPEAPLALRIAVAEVGPHYLPQEFDLILPRALDPAAPASVFEPQRISLVRAPSAPVHDGWAVLRVRVTQRRGSTRVSLPGVLVRVFRPGAPDRPIGVGMTDWRGAVTGEALVPVIGIQRFRPGGGPSVIETSQEIELEATRDDAFTGAPGQLPNVARLMAGTGLIRRRDRPPGSGLDIVLPGEVLPPPPPPVPPPPPPEPMRVQAGRERTVHLGMA
jgi:hypothetical protein